MEKVKYEGSALDKKRDKKVAKIYGLSLKAYEKSAMDAAEDAYFQHKLDKKAKKK